MNEYYDPNSQNQQYQQYNQPPYQPPVPQQPAWLDSGYPQGEQRPMVNIPPTYDDIQDAPPKESDYAPAESAEDFDQPRPRVRHSLLGRRNRHEE